MNEIGSGPRGLYFQKEQRLCVFLPPDFVWTRLKRTFWKGSSSPTGCVTERYRSYHRHASSRVCDQERSVYPRWCPTWSSSPGSSCRSPGTPGRCRPPQTGSSPAESANGRQRFSPGVFPERLQVQGAHPDLVVDQPVLRVLVKLLLGVDVDPVGSQLLPDLQAEAKREGGAGGSGASFGLSYQGGNQEPAQENRRYRQLLLPSV